MSAWKSVFGRWGMKSVLSISRGPMSCLAWLKLMPTRPPPSGGGGGQFELTRHSDPPVTTLISFPFSSLLLSFLFFPRSTMEEAKASNTCRGRRRDGMYACGLSYLHPEHGLGFQPLVQRKKRCEFTPGDKTILSPSAGDLLANSQCTSMDERERAEARMERTGAAEGRKERKKSFWNALNS